jgi:hypothetical protein
MPVFCSKALDASSMGGLLAEPQNAMMRFSAACKPGEQTRKTIEIISKRKIILFMLRLLQRLK